jgi:hypothetical protein
MSAPQNVPQFVFWKAGEEVDRFATRDKAKVAEAITRHSTLTTEDLDLTGEDA